MRLVLMIREDWDTHHEVAWNWLWENVERMLRLQINPKAEWSCSMPNLYAKHGRTKRVLTAFDAAVYICVYTYYIVAYI